MITAKRLRRLTLFGTPVALMVLMFMHGGDDFGDYTTVQDGGKWAAMHFLTLPFYGLLALSVYLLTDGFSGWWPKIGRAGALVFAVFYSAYEGANGIAAGLFMRKAAAYTTAEPEWDGIVLAVKAVGNEWVLMLVDKIGAAGLVLALVAVAITLSKVGVSKLPLGMLILSSAILLGAHAEFYGLLAMAIYLAGVWWTETGDWGTGKGAPNRE